MKLDALQDRSDRNSEFDNFSRGNRGSYPFLLVVAGFPLNSEYRWILLESFEYSFVQQISLSQGLEEKGGGNFRK